MRVCTGPVASFDGTKLDTTVTVPAKKPKRALPLIVFIHGLLSSKNEYISDKEPKGGVSDTGSAGYMTLRWNNLWFARRGYAVINYSARGHGDSEGQLQLASKHFEIPDARRIVGAVVDDGQLARIAASRVGVIGSSYGGGQAWLLMTTRDDGKLPFGTWRSPKGRLVRLAALVPGYTWTDLVQTLLPNGHQRSRGVVDPATANTPVGVPKISLMDGFIAAAGAKFPPDIYRYLSRTTAGEPYEGDPQVDEAKRALSEDRSAYFQDDYFAALKAGTQKPLPVLAGQGLTDPIFSPLEVVRMWRRLRAARPHYPLGMYFGDFEHLTSLVKLPDLGTFHDLGNRFLDHFLRGKRNGWRFDARMAVSNCNPKRFGPVLRAPTWDGLHPQQVTFALPGSQQTASPLSDPRGQESDPVVLSVQRGRGCITTTRDATPGIATWKVPVEQAFTLAGMPRLRMHFSALATDITFVPRLWDVAPDGTQTLVTRGAWRSVGTDAAGGDIDFELFGAAWRFARGHQLMLEIPQVDATYFRADNFASSATVENVRLVLPTARRRS